MLEDYNIREPPAEYGKILQRLPVDFHESFDTESRAAAARKYLHQEKSFLEDNIIEALIIKSLITQDDHVLLVGTIPEDEY